MLIETEKKNFLIINSYFLGDILLTNSLVQNIKRIFPNSNIIMLAPSHYEAAAKYQKDVDEVIIWNRKGEHKGILGIIKFLKNFPYKNIYAAFPIYGSQGSMNLAKLLNAKYILAPKSKRYSRFWRKSKYDFVYEGEKTQTQMLSVLNGITKERLIDCPIKFYPPENASIKLPQNYIALVPSSTRMTKEIPTDTIESIVENHPEKNFVLLGKGESIKRYSEILKDFKNVIDFSNKLSLEESSYVLSNSLGSICCDTGFLHMSYAMNIPTVGVFYEHNMERFMPDETMYKKVSIIKENQTAENIFNTLIQKKGE